MEEEQKAVAGDDASLAKTLEKMTSKELREYALGIPGIEGVHAMKKEELLSAIRKAKGLPEDENRKGKAAEKSVLTALQIKGRIQELRALQDTARRAGEANRVRVLRRKMNRLKKQCRSVGKA